MLSKTVTFLWSDGEENIFLMVEMKGVTDKSYIDRVHVTLFIGKSHVSHEIIGLCKRFDKWSTAYGASRTTEGWAAEFATTILSSDFLPP